MRRTPSLALLAAMTALGMSSLHIVVPALPILAAFFADGTASVQLVLSLYLAGIAGGQLVYGPLSDRFGRRPVLLAGLMLFLLGTLLCGCAWSLPALIAGRVLQGSGACAGIVLARAIIRDVHEREAAARGIALVMMVMTLAPAISPAIGAYLAVWVDWRAIFVLLGSAGAIVLALTAMRLPETNTRPVRLDMTGMVLSYISLLRSPQFLGFALCSACTSASWFTFCGSAPYLLTTVMHRSPSAYGAMILLPMASYMLGNAIAVRFTESLGILRMFAAGILLSFVSGVAMALWCLADPTPWALFIPITMSSIGNGMSQPPAMAAGLSINPQIAGAASGLIGCLQMAVAGIGTFAVGLFPYDSVLPMVTIVGAFMALAIMFGLPVARLPGSLPEPVLVPAETGS